MAEMAERIYGGLDITDEGDGRSIVLAGSKLQREDILRSISSGIIGQLQCFTTPYGEKAVVYADWTASGRLLFQVEKYLSNVVMPFYGNTHTSTSITGHQSTCFRHEARQIIAQAVNAKVTGKAAEDVVLFTGNGTTSAVTKLVQSLGLHIPLPSNMDIDERPVVFTSSYEHHSNLLPWRESSAQVITIKYSPITGVCLLDLEAQLRKHTHRKVLKIGTFSAASNVTGVLTSVNKVSTLLHVHGALAFFDYATAAPYTYIDMNPALDPLAYKDAIFFSGHKFIGGPGAPGVLVAKRNIMTPRDSTPTEPGGGTVFYVTEGHHRYLSNREEREEGGTPYILGDVKLGLVVQLKQSIGSAWILEEELRISTYFQSKLEALAGDCIVLLGRRRNSFSPPSGATNQNHLPIFSFLVRAGTRFLHHNFVCALLNDLFGIQTRGGCQCAGPFSQQLLGITIQTNAELEASLLEKHEVLRPGYSRFSIPYWSTVEEIDYILDAVVFVALHGVKFLPSYRFNHRTGEWAHSTRLTRFPERKWISSFDVTAGEESYSTAGSKVSKPMTNFQEMLLSAQAELAKIEKSKHQGMKGIDSQLGAELGGAWSHLRWFVLPGDEILPIPLGGANQQPPVGPIQPPSVDQLINDQSFSVENDQGRQLFANVLEGASAYAQHRNEKLPAHLSGGKSKDAPRYVQLGDSIVPAAVTIGYEPGLQAPIKPSISISQSEQLATPSQTTLVTQLKQQSGNCLMGSCITAPVKALHPSALSTVVAKPVLPPKKIMKLVGQCVREWSMIEDGDRLCLGLSGGKDSLSLLHVLIALQKRAPVRFTISCATVDPQTSSFDPSPLIPYLQSLGITYHYLSQPIVDMATSRLQGDSLCAFCARFKRGLLYTCCRDNGYNKLLLAQHLDDFAESFLMSALHNGQMRTMKANYKIDAGDLTVIRPFAYVRELQLRQFAVDTKLPVINENCPACFEQPKERARIKQLLQQEESMVPALFFNLRRALVPLMHDDSYAAMAAVAERIEKAGLRRSESTKGKAAQKASASGSGVEGVEHNEQEDEDGEGQYEGKGGVRPPSKRSRKDTCRPDGQGCPIDFDQLLS